MQVEGGLSNPDLTRCNNVIYKDLDNFEHTTKLQGTKTKKKKANKKKLRQFMCQNNPLNDGEA